MRNKSLPFKNHEGAPEIGKLLYDLCDQIHVVVPSSIESEMTIEYLQTSEFISDFLDEVWYPIVRESLSKQFEERINEMNYPDDYRRIKNILLQAPNRHALAFSLYTYDVFVRLDDANKFISSIDFISITSNDMNDVLQAIGTEPVNKSGRFSKRLATYFYKMYGHKFDTATISMIGNIYNRHSLSSKRFVVSLTNNFDWEDGLFGNEDSCWWGCYSDSRDTLYWYGGYGLLFYPDDDNTDDRDGIGRMWVFPINENMLIGFNTYGVQGREAAAVMAKLLEKYTSDRWMYGKRYFNGSDDCYYPYINGDNGHNSEGGSRVFVIYRGETPDKDTVNFYFRRRSGVFSKYVQCDRCGEEYQESELEHGRCYECRAGLYFCSRCENWTEDNYSFIDVEGHYCEYCYNEVIHHYCNNCGASIRFTSSYTDYGWGEVAGTTYCYECLPEEENE